MPTLATGYGPMTIDAFARAFAGTVLGHYPIDAVTIVVRSDENARVVNSVLAAETSRTGSPNMVFTQGRGFVLGASFGLPRLFALTVCSGLPRRGHRLFGNAVMFW